MPHSYSWERFSLKIQSLYYYPKPTSLATAPQPPTPSPAPLSSSSVNPIVGDTDNPSLASHHAPIHICLKDPSKFPNQLPYSISQKYQQRLKAIITKLLCQGLLCPTHSPYNMPIPPVKKPNGSYHLVQDLRLMQLLSPYTQ